MICSLTTRNDEILELNRLGITTRGSCCGHGGLCCRQIIIFPCDEQLLRNLGYTEIGKTDTHWFLLPQIWRIANNLLAGETKRHLVKKITVPGSISRSRRS